MQEKYFCADRITLFKMVPRFLRKVDSMLRELAEIFYKNYFLWWYLCARKVLLCRLDHNVENSTPIFAKNEFHVEKTSVDCLQNLIFHVVPMCKKSTLVLTGSHS